MQQDPLIYDRKSFAKMISKTQTQVKQLVKDGLPEKKIGRKYCFDLKEVIRWFVQRRAAKADDQSKDLIELRKEELRLKNSIRELDLAVKNDDLVDATVFKQELQIIAGNLRDQIKKAMEIVGPKAVEVFNQIIDKTLNEVE